MYLEMATEEDKKMAENWKADADGILIFVRHYLLHQQMCTLLNLTYFDWIPDPVISSPFLASNIQ